MEDQILNDQINEIIDEANKKSAFLGTMKFLYYISLGYFFSYKENVICREMLFR